MAANHADSRERSMHSFVLRRQGLSCLFELLEARRLLSAGIKGGAFVGPVRPNLDRLPAPTLDELFDTPSLSTLPPPSTPPSGPVDPVAEYEPMESLVVAWMGSAAQNDMLAQIAQRVTVQSNGRMYIGVPNAATQTSAISTLTSRGADLNDITFFTAPLDTIWLRDYGPRYVYEGDVRVITDHKYNRPRPADDVQPNDFALLKQHQYYEIGLNNTTLVHGGGNYHLNGAGDAYSTQLIANENPTLTPAQIQQIWSTYQNNNTTITGAFPSSVDATQHIDMWMQIYDDNKVFIGDFANPSGAAVTADAVADSTASLMASRGYQVTRLPNYSIGGTHYTFT